MGVVQAWILMSHKFDPGRGRRDHDGVERLDVSAIFFVRLSDAAFVLLCYALCELYWAIGEKQFPRGAMSDVSIDIIVEFANEFKQIGRAHV